MTVALRWTVDDLRLFPDDGKRRELIDGELYVSTQPHWHHQGVADQVAFALETWNRRTKAGRVRSAPGIVFAKDDAVAPDVVWISRERLKTALGKDGKLHGAPELVVEVLSFGKDNEERDKELKLGLYSRRGVLEYWILDWRTQQVDVYRRQEAVLRRAATLYAEDLLTTPLLPGFVCPVAELFEGIPAEDTVEEE